MKPGQLNTVEPIDGVAVDSEPKAEEAKASDAETLEPTTPVEAETPEKAESVELTLEQAIEAATRFLQSEGYVVRQATASQRATLLKADPDEVREYFDSTGLTRKQLADALGITVSVIATVQNQNGDRWSQVRFEAGKILIEAYKQALAARVAAAATPQA